MSNPKKPPGRAHNIGLKMEKNTLQPSFNGNITKGKFKVSTN